MPIEDLEDFIRIAQKGSFGKAADSMYMTQSGMSKKVARLEAKLGFSLFDRNTRSNMLSPAGRVFYKGAIEIVGLYKETVRKAKETALGKGTVVRIGGDMTNSKASLAVDLLMGYAESLGLPFTIEFAEGSANVGITSIDETDSLSRLLKHSFDIAVMIIDDQVIKAPVVIQKLFNDPLVFCVSEESGFEDLQQVELSELCNMAFIEALGWPIMNREIVRFCKEAGFEPRFRQRYIESMGHVAIHPKADEVIVTTKSMEHMVAPRRISGVVKLACSNPDICLTWAAVCRNDNATDEVTRCMDLLQNIASEW